MTLKIMPQIQGLINVVAFVFFFNFLDETTSYPLTKIRKL